VATINTAAISNSATYGNGFPPTMAAIGNNDTTTITCTNAELIDTVLTSGIKSGYTLQLSAGQFRATARPALARLAMAILMATW
jgi:hypothetical protein